MLKEDEQMECNLLPRGARIIVQSDEYSYTGLVIVPESAKRRPTTGTIIAAGSEAEICKVSKGEAHEDVHHFGAESKEVCNQLHIGDRVLYGQFSGTLVQFKGRPAYTILGADEILAKVDVGESLEYTAAG